MSAFEFRVGLCAALVMQTLFFFAFLAYPTKVISDNIRYEEAGFQLASGHGLSLPFRLYPDEQLKSDACRSIQSCSNDSVPTAAYPPGYQLFIAAIYFVSGMRSPTLLVAIQGVLNAVLAVVFAFLLRRLSLGRTQFWCGILLLCVYPFLARQATQVTSDFVHAALLFGAFTALLAKGHERWPRGYGLLAGALLAAASLTRPYSVVTIPFVFWALRGTWSRLSQWYLAVSLGLLHGAWMLRNYLVFDRLIPLSTTGLGISLYGNILEAKYGLPTTSATERLYNEAVAAAAGGQDAVLPGPNRALLMEFIEWVTASPLEFLRLIPYRVIRLWISQGQGPHDTLQMFMVATLLGGTLVVGLHGMWLVRDRLVGRVSAALMLPYWAFLLHSVAEARRTLGIRLPLLVLVSFAACHYASVVRSFMARRSLKRSTQESVSGFDLGKEP